MRTFPHFSVSDQEKRFVFFAETPEADKAMKETEKPGLSDMNESMDSPQKAKEVGAKNVNEARAVEVRSKNALTKLKEAASDKRVDEKTQSQKNNVKVKASLPISRNEAAIQKQKEKWAVQAKDGVPRFKASSSNPNSPASARKAEPYGPGYDPSLMESNDARSLNSEKRKPAEKATPKGGDGSRSAGPDKPADTEIPKGEFKRTPSKKKPFEAALKNNRLVEDIKNRVSDSVAHAIQDITVEGGGIDSAQKFLDQANAALAEMPVTENKAQDKNSVTKIIRQALGGTLTKDVGIMKIIGSNGQLKIEMKTAAINEKSRKEESSDAPENLETFNSKFDDTRNELSSAVLNKKGVKDPSVTLLVSKLNNLIRDSKAKGINVESKVRSMDGVKIIDSKGVTWGRYDYDEETGGLDVFMPKPEKSDTTKEKAKPETKSEKEPDAKKSNEANPESKEVEKKDFETVRAEEMFKREMEKYSKATEKWSLLSSVGKCDKGGNRFMYKKVDGKLFAYAPATGLQEMDSKTGTWKILGTRAEDGEYNAVRAEARNSNQNKYVADEQENEKNTRMESWMKYDNKDSFTADTFSAYATQDCWDTEGNRAIRDALANSDKTGKKEKSEQKGTEKKSDKSDAKKPEAAKEKTVVDDAPAEAEIPTPKVDKLAEAKPEEKKSDAAKIEEPKPGEKPAEKKAEGKPADGEKKDAKPEAGDKKDEKKTEAEVKKEVEKKAGEKVEAAKDKADSGRFDYDSAIADAKKEINEAKTPEEKLVAGLTLIVLTIGKMIDKNFGEKKDGKEGGGKEGKESKGGTESKEGEKLKSDRQSRLKEELKDHVKKGDKNDVDSLIKEKQDKVDAKVDKGVERKKELDKKINGSDKEISTLETQKNTVKTSLNTAQDQLTALSQKDAAGNKEQIATLKDQIKSFQSDLSDLDTKIDAVKTIKSRAEKEKTDINTEIDEDKDGKDLKEDIKTLKEMKDAADKNAKEMQESFDAGIKPLIDANPLLRGKSVISTYNFKTLEPVVIFDKAIVAEIKKLAGDGADVGSAFEEGGTVKDFDKVKKLFETIKDKVKKPEEKKS